MFYLQLSEPVKLPSHFYHCYKKARVIQHISQAPKKNSIFLPWLPLKTRECRFLEGSSYWSSKALDFIQAFVVSSTALLSAVSFLKSCT